MAGPFALRTRLRPGPGSGPAAGASVTRHHRRQSKRFLGSCCRFFQRNRCLGFEIPPRAWPALTPLRVLAEQILKEVGIVRVELEMFGPIGPMAWAPSVRRASTKRGSGFKRPGERFIVLPAFLRSLQGVVGFVDNLELLLGTFVPTRLVWVVLPGKGKPRLPYVVFRSVLSNAEYIVEGLCSVGRHGQ